MSGQPAPICYIATIGIPSIAATTYLIFPRQITNNAYTAMILFFASIILSAFAIIKTQRSIYKKLEALPEKDRFKKYTSFPYTLFIDHLHGQCSDGYDLHRKWQEESEKSDNVEPTDNPDTLTVSPPSAKTPPPAR